MSDNTERRLAGSTNPKFWAREFIKVVKENPDLVTNESAMTDWFHNAFEAGRDEAWREIVE